VLELLDADRSKHCYDRGFSALGGHFLSGTSECPPERREPDSRERNSAATAPHIAGFILGWIFISSPWIWQKRTSPASTEESYRAASAKVRLGNYSEDAGAARLCLRRCFLPGGKLRRTSTPWTTHRPLGRRARLGYTMSSGEPGFLDLQGFRVLGFGMERRSRSTPPPGRRLPRIVRLHPSPGERVLDALAPSWEETRLRDLGVPLEAPASRKPWGLVEMLLADPGGHAVILFEVPEDHFLRRKL